MCVSFFVRSLHSHPPARRSSSTGTLSGTKPSAKEPAAARALFERTATAKATATVTATVSGAGIEAATATATDTGQTQEQ